MEHIVKVKAHTFKRNKRIYQKKAHTREIPLPCGQPMNGECEAAVSGLNDGKCVCFNTETWERLTKQETKAAWIK